MLSAAIKRSEFGRQPIYQSISDFIIACIQEKFLLILTFFEKPVGNGFEFGYNISGEFVLDRLVFCG